MTALEFPTPDPRSLDESIRPFAEAVSGQYAIKRMIGRGGMGVVMLARDLRLDRLVAIKTLPAGLSKDPSLRERFLRESRTAGAMSHPNIVPIHGADEVRGHVFFVMSFVDGESLAARVRSQGPQPAQVVARHLRDVAAALSHAHARGIIHRDIKAENILLERDSGRALVTDFGIARLAEATPLTATGQVLGTVYYVSPEQVSGDTVDSRSDIYSLGVVGFLALTGRFPFDGEVASAVLVSHVTKNAPPVNSYAPQAHPALATIIDRCLRKDPAHRYESAEKLREALDAALPSLDHPASPALVSDTEALQVWKRASELQAQTGVVPRPEPIARERDAAKDARRRSGVGLGDVRAAAVEAGIDDRYVEHALKEHGLAPGGIVPVPKVAKPVVEAKPMWWTKTSLDIVRETEVKGEMPARDVERLINVLRDETGQMGNTIAKTRELAWWSGWFGRRLDVAVVPGNGKTMVRVTRSTRFSAFTAMFITLWFPGLPLGMIFATLAFEMGGRDAEPIAILGGFGVGFYAALKTGRWLAKWLRGRRDDRVRRIEDALVGKVQESVAASR
jgi:serine/threonine protein kinase